jgi:hypothetical protein
VLEVFDGNVEGALGCKTLEALGEAPRKGVQAAEDSPLPLENPGWTEHRLEV